MINLHILGKVSNTRDFAIIWMRRIRYEKSFIRDIVLVRPRSRRGFFSFDVSDKYIRLRVTTICLCMYLHTSRKSILRVNAKIYILMYNVGYWTVMCPCINVNRSPILHCILIILFNANLHCTTSTLHQHLRITHVKISTEHLCSMFCNYLIGLAASRVFTTQPIRIKQT